MITNATIPPRDGAQIVRRRWIAFPANADDTPAGLLRNIEHYPCRRARGDSRLSLFVILWIAICMLGGACVYYNFFY